MGKKLNRSNATGKVRTKLVKLQQAADEGDDALLLHTYSLLCSLVGRDVTDASIGEKLREKIKAAHENTYRPKEPATTKEGGEQHDGKHRHRHGRKPSYA